MIKNNFIVLPQVSFHPCRTFSLFLPKYSFLDQSDLGQFISVQMNEITNIVLRTRRFLLLVYFEISFYMRYVVVRLVEENLLQLRKHTKRLNK